MGTTDNKRDTPKTGVVRVPLKFKARIKIVREREVQRIGIELSEAAIVRRALELGLAQMERTK